MSIFYTKQPNGLYCAFSTYTDRPIRWNMTRQELVEYHLGLAREKALQELDRYFAGTMPPFSRVLDNFRAGEMTVEQFKQFLFSVGDDPESYVLQQDGYYQESEE